MPQRNRIDHENVAMDSLVQSLRQACSDQHIEHKKVPRGQDPPDFWLTIDGNTFAVEETCIADEASVRAVDIARKKGATGGSLGSKWEGEARAELTELIDDAVRVKRSKLEAKGVSQRCQGSILLLYDAYGYGETEDAKVALQNVPDYGWFHSIFWAASFSDRPNALYPEEPGRTGSFLYTKEDRWKAQPSR